ncbi:MAG: EVE domain-containing protein [Bacteroidales bacterium]|jgi:hypothetical protein|nr:EVE domain-containing protein [Bacteroidales bacterium]
MIDRKQVYKDFQTAFPKGKLTDMTLEQYTNLEKKDSFCYWLESKTKELGSISGGSSFKFGIYEYKNKPDLDDPRIVSDDKYAWYRKYNCNTSEEAFKFVRSVIVKIAKCAESGDFETIEDVSELGDVLKWKIAFLYSNQTLIPVYRQDMLVELANHFNMANANQAKISDIQRFLIKQKGEKDLFSYYDELLEILKPSNINVQNNRIWLYAPGRDASKWNECLSQNIMCIGWDKIGDITACEKKDEITNRLQKIYKKPNSTFTNDNLALWQFSKEMQIGDIVIAKKGYNKIIGRGVIKSDYEFDDTRENYKHVRKVQWTDNGEWPYVGPKITKTLTDISKSNFAKKIKNLFNDKTEKNYWWLVASPKIWSLAKMPVGEVQNYTLYNDNGNQRKVFQNFLDAKKGDIVIGYEATPVKQVVALAVVEKSADDKAIYFKKTEALLNPIDYSEIKDNPELNNMEFIRNKNGSFFKLTPEEYNTLIDIIREDNPIQTPKQYPGYKQDQFLKEVFIQPEEYARLKLLLLSKKNIILQGAPGVGKTFSAKRLAYSIMGEKDNSRIEFIQFHQNYSYEDFIMGYKPKEGGGFELKRGVFYNFCKKAQNDPSKAYFFIIDEINRGNLSKIFGELLMLIERDYRGGKNEIRLAYNDETFFVPENLYIIGMMNTADRSLAMIDYALRRRFSFFDIRPGFDSNGFKTYKASMKNELFNQVIDAIKNINKDIEKDDSLGKGFCIGHSYFCNQSSIDKMWLSNVINYDIIPMLSEYWFDNKGMFEKESEILLNLIK